MKRRRVISRGCCCALIALLFVCHHARAAEWFTLSSDDRLVRDVASSPVEPELAVRRADQAGVDVSAQLTGLVLDTVQRKAGRFTAVTWPESAIHGAIGHPALPVIRRLIVVPDGAVVVLEVRAGGSVQVNLAASGYPGTVYPRQAPVPKLPGARQNAPFALDAEAYGTDALLPADRARVTDLGIVRGHRLALLEIAPVAYNPVRGELVLWPELEVKVEFKGGHPVGDAARSLGPSGDVVVNPPAEPLTLGAGNYLIIVPTTFEAELAAFVNAKTAQGFTVMTHVIAPGTSSTMIKAHVESLWGTPDQPDYLLLVGDTNSIPHWTGGGTGSPATDIQYACMDGPGDWYPDIAIGRFPVRSPEQLQDVITKTLFFEEENYADPGYVERAVFMASEDNYGVSEGTHNWVIENYMAPNGFACDELYCHTYNATTQQVRDAFNDGRLLGIYSGHGGTYSWADGPPFSQGDVRGLYNDGMYAFVCSFACITGTYTVTECFTETWALEPDKGAAAIYGSSVNSYWGEDDILEKKLFEAIYDDDIREVSPAWQTAFVRYLSHYGATSTTRRYFEMYNLMGDPSLFLPYPGGGHHMRVSPAGSFATEGPNGGPFTPASNVYTIFNDADFAVDYEVGVDQPWVSVDNPTGTIPAGSFADITVSVTSAAEDLDNGHYEAIVSFANMTDHDGDTTRVVTLEVGVPELIYGYPLDTSPGWSMEGLWGFGRPIGSGGAYGGPDPDGGHTGISAYGYNLAGDYENSMPERNLTSAAIDCSALTQVHLKFWRWLGVESPTYDHASVRVSNNGTSWVTVWENGGEITDTDWTHQVLDISAVADQQPTVYVRWTMGTTDSSWQYCGWNVDDVEIWGVPPISQAIPADVNGDGTVDVNDLTVVIVSWGPCPDPPAPCPADVNGDGVVNVEDLVEVIVNWS